MFSYRLFITLGDTISSKRSDEDRIPLHPVQTKPFSYESNWNFSVFPDDETKETGEEKRKKKKKRRGRLSKRGLGQECRPSGTNSKTRRLLDGWGKGMVSLWRENAGPFLSQPNSSSALSFHIYIFRQKIFRVKRKLKENPLTRITCGWWRGKR